MKDKKIKKDLVNICLISILSYLGCFITIDDNYFQSYIYIKMGCMMILILYIFVYHRIMINNRFIKVNLCFALLSFLILTSSIINWNYIYSSGDYVISSINFIIGVLGMMFAVEYSSYKQKMYMLIKVYYILTICVVLIMDIYIFLYPNKSAASGDIYFIGTKFTVSYFHLFLIAFYILKQNQIRKKNIIPILILGVLAWMISMKVDCMTGIVGVFIFGILYVFSRKTFNLLTKPYVYMITMFISGLFVVFYSVVMRLRFVGDFLENVLHTSTELTGRTWIYRVLPVILMKKPLLGNGFRSSFDVMMHTMRAPNTQNGLTEWIIEGGIITTVVFLCMVWMIFKSVKNVNINLEANRYKAIYSMMYVLAVLSTVEIIYNREIYFVWLALLFGILTEREIYEQKKIKQCINQESENR